MKLNAYYLLSLFSLSFRSATGQSSAGNAQSDLTLDEAKNLSGTPPTDPFYIVNEQPFSLSDATWTLSSILYSSANAVPNTNVDNLMIYGQYTVDPNSGISFGADCTAFFGNTECSCTLCTQPPTDSDSWVVGSGITGPVFFECNNIMEGRRCTGTTAPPSTNETTTGIFLPFAPDHKCHYVEGTFQGIESCHTDDPAADDDVPDEAPTMMPTTSTNSSASSSSTSSFFLLYLVGFLPSFGMLAFMG